MIDPKTEFDLKLTADAVNVVMGALSEAPYRIAAPVIETIAQCDFPAVGPWIHIVGNQSDPTKTVLHASASAAISITHGAVVYLDSLCLRADGAPGARCPVAECHPVADREHHGRVGRARDRTPPPASSSHRCRSTPRTSSAS